MTTERPIDLVKSRNQSYIAQDINKQIGVRNMVTGTAIEKWLKSETRAVVKLSTATYSIYSDDVMNRKSSRQVVRYAQYVAVKSLGNSDAKSIPRTSFVCPCQGRFGRSMLCPLPQIKI